ncbi:nickel pincer cofactor biosynthesis protein LarB [Acidicapsa dinghuensis]|uniref:Nickel pincer cofactor biosynthesis protein LarB n=1 Tax=Acidicapsa dinghuensis TaxID=2218256 RepID=A0ABW1EGF9_9BACT|nr:nickel pincer cofactor biosynthesis protein LarB [Acidicapsa dinghuensis]
MNREQLHQLMSAVESGEVSPEAACDRLKTLPFEDLGFAKVDHHRPIRTGMPEVIYCEGKTTEQVAKIFNSLAASGVNVLATRANAEHRQAIFAAEPRSVEHVAARCVTLKQNDLAPRPGRIGIVCAGTSDLPVAEEARVTAELMGNQVDLVADVGVAGLHRLLSQHHRLQEASVLIVCAGMEGALPSVVGGLVGVPVIAVPTSVGYGASFGGLAALLGMLNSCSPNIAVVNIDNGFGAAYVATLMNRAY